VRTTGTLYLAAKPLPSSALYKRVRGSTMIQAT
jgi:hypothetical protein